MAQVDLSRPVTVDGAEVEAVEVVEPKVGQLKGLNTFSLLQMDVNAHLTLLPRVTAPPISADQLAEMRPKDFARLQAEVVRFLAEEDAPAI
ncbi:MAG: phage tail assembly protein [Pseudomonadota bacterium]